MDGCKRNDDFVKCESCLATVDDTWIFVAASLLFIDSDRKFLYRQKPKHFAIDKLIYFHEAKERIRAPQEEFQEISNELTTTLIELKTKFPSSFRRDRQSRSNKHNGIRGEAFTAERILASCKTHLKRACWKGV